MQPVLIRSHANRLWQALHVLLDFKKLGHAEPRHFCKICFRGRQWEPSCCNFPASVLNQHPPTPLKTPQIPSNRDQKARNRGILGVLGMLGFFKSGIYLKAPKTSRGFVAGPGLWLWVGGPRVPASRPSLRNIYHRFGSPGYGTSPCQGPGA